jgi:hypothetical protein
MRTVMEALFRPEHGAIVPSLVKTMAAVVPFSDATGEIRAYLASICAPDRGNEFATFVLQNAGNVPRLVEGVEDFLIAARCASASDQWLFRKRQDLDDILRQLGGPYRRTPVRPRRCWLSCGGSKCDTGGRAGCWVPRLESRSI